MSGSGSQQQTQTQSATSAPWAPTQPLLNSVLGSLSGLSTNETPQQAAAASQMMGGAAGIPNLTPQATTGVTGLLNGGGASAYSPMLQSAYTALGTNLSPFTSPTYLDPMSNPYLGSALKTMNQDITNQVGDQFAAAGETNSPAFATALARGLSQGEGGLLTGQYNTNVGAAQNAASTLFGAGNTAATGLTGFNQLGNQNIMSGLQGATAIPGLAMAPGGAQLTAANAGAQQPFTNMGWLTSLLYPAAALGGQTSGTGTSSGSYTQPWSQTFGQVGQGLQGMGNFLWSDERLKEEIAPVGLLFDSTPIYSYRYKGDSTPRIGVMAQDIEQTNPDAVREFDGVKAVDYDKATAPSRAIAGLLSDLAMVA